MSDSHTVSTVPKNTQSGSSLFTKQNDAGCIMIAIRIDELPAIGTKE